MIAFLGGLWKAWGLKMVVYTTVTALMAAYALHLHGKLSAARAQLADLRRSLAAASEESRLLQDAITRQNTEIERWQAEAANQTRLQEKARKETALQRVLAASRVREVFLEPLPTAADDLIAQMAKDAQKRGSW